MPDIHFNDFRDYQEEQRQKKRTKIFDPNFVYQIDDIDENGVFFEEKELIPFLRSNV